MKHYEGTELESYRRGINAGYRIEEYEKNNDPECRILPKAKKVMHGGMDLVMQRKT